MQRPPMIAAKRAADNAGESARDAATNPWSVRLARCGYATKGVVYLLVGILAARAAFGRGGQTTDNRGAIAALSQQPFGRILVALVALGLFAYALWLFAAATLDPERKGADAKGAATRLGDAALGCSYAALGVVAARLVLQRGGGKSSDQATRDWTARLLAHPFGATLVALIGVAVLGAAGFFFWQAATARFRDELDLRGANAAERGRRRGWGTRWRCWRSGRMGVRCWARWRSGWWRTRRTRSPRRAIAAWCASDRAERSSMDSPSTAQMGYTPNPR